MNTILYDITRTQYFMTLHEHNTL